MARPLDHPPGAAFLLAALGSHATCRFTERLAALGLTPAHDGLLRAVASTPGQSQQAVAQLLRLPPSRLVALVDTLADRGLVERRRNPDDRRLHALHLTDDGRAVLCRVATMRREHNDVVFAALDPDERDVLREMLVRVADHHGLVPGVHPGVRALGDQPTGSGTS